MVVGGLAIAAIVVACKASLETQCVGGDGSCDEREVVTSTGGTGGTGGTEEVYVLPADCYEGCDTMTVSGATGEFPCAVAEVMTNCQRCHTEDPNPVTLAPFPLDTYEQSLQLYGTTVVWSHIARVIVEFEDFMPLQEPKLTVAQKRALLDDWACICAPPRAADEICD